MWAEPRTLLMTDPTPSLDLDDLGAAEAAIVAAAVERAVETERARIARELHDSVLGILIGATLSAQRAAVFLPETEAQRLSSAIDELDLVMKAIRHSIYDLRRPGPSFIRHELLDEIESLEQRFDVDVEIDFDGTIESVSPVVTPHLPRVVAEAVTNAVRHGQASRIWIRFVTDAAHLTVEAEDNGRGPAHRGAPNPDGGNGLRNLADRATELGGWSRIEARPNGGTRLTWQVPVGA